MEAKEHAEIAQKEADKADMEWRKSLAFATEASARSDACMKYQLHAGLVRTLNRLIGFAARTEALDEEGKAPLGADPPEVEQVGTMLLRVSKQLKGVEGNIATLGHSRHKLDDHCKKNRSSLECETTAPAVKKALRKLEQQRKTLQEIHDDLSKADSMIRAQVPEIHAPPYLSKGLLRPSQDEHAGEPYWPEKPPKPAEAHRLMLLRPLRPGPGFGTPEEGASFL